MGFTSVCVNRDAESGFFCGRSATEKPLQSLKQRGTFDLAFPHREHLPTIVAQRGQVSPIALTIATDLRRPIFSVGRRHARAAFAVVAVPEAAVDEDDQARTGKHQVRLCVQRRLACSAGDKPAGVEVRAP
jgi:hypothetical protein